MEYARALERHRAVLHYRRTGLTLQKIGDKFHITRERVRQLLLVRRFPTEEEYKHAHRQILNHEWARIGGSQKGRQRARALVRIRDNYTCRTCGSIRTPEYVKSNNQKHSTLKGRIKLFDVHHLDGQCGKNSRGYDSVHDISRLITLCHKCHFNHPQHRFKLETKGAIKIKT